MSRSRGCYRTASQVAGEAQHLFTLGAKAGEQVARHTLADPPTFAGAQRVAWVLAIAEHDNQPVGGPGADEARIVSGARLKMSHSTPKENRVGREEAVSELDGSAEALGSCSPGCAVTAASRRCAGSIRPLTRCSAPGGTSCLRAARSACRGRRRAPILRSCTPRGVAPRCWRAPFRSRGRQSPGGDGNSERRLRFRRDP